MSKRASAVAAAMAASALAAVLAMAGCGSQDGAPDGGSSSLADAQDAATSVVADAQDDDADLEAADVELPANSGDSEPIQAAQLGDGQYEAEFNTDSSMFHANESVNGKGVLTVAGDQMTFHVPLVSKRIVNLYLGTADEAEADPANWLQPVEEEVTYSDGYTETVYAFDIPVSAIGEPFDVALLGKKGKWYNHKVSVDNPVGL